MSRIASLIFRNWFGEPEPPVRLRQPSARWSGGADSAWAGTASSAPARVRGRPGPVSVRAPSARWSQHQPIPRGRSHELVVSAIVEETPTTRTLVLESPDADLVEFRAGQHLTIELELEGERHRRCYSLSKAPGNGAVQITVKRVADGRISNHLCDTLRVGARLQVSAPAGTFTVEPDSARASRYLMIAGGVGITPIISMIEALLAGEPGSRLHLIYGSRSPGEIIFRERLEQLAQDYPEALSIQLAVDQPEAGWQGLSGVLTPDRVVDAIDCPAEIDEVYLCGPAPMMKALFPALARIGISTDSIHAEHFAYADRASANHPTQSYNVRFARSGRSVASKPGEALLHTALAAGVDLAFSCQMGGCGQCKVQTVSGSAVMDEPNCLNTAERESGYILTCCAYPSSDLVIADR